MGLNFSVLNKFGVPGLSAATTKQVYERHFANKDTKEFKDFHIAYVEFCKFFNTVMPGQDFDTPSTTEIQKFFDNVWKPEKNEEERKRLFLEFMKKEVKETKVVDDSFFVAAGLAVPVAAVVGKRASGHIPYVKSVRLDLVPNVVFVPFVTLLGIVGATAWQMGNKSAAAKEEEKKTSKQRAAEEQKDVNQAP
ncbi:uncharacterized protein LOC8055073 [Sorghum bicolor]|uniref:Calcium ion binding protein n=1 Tax=Sorghum bicolor TaxID=4558 RepID=C5XT72_SORBI|nr:uncharacterized protein LOC8055073 [Sorghum bicolor]EES04431.1 hypothetical protein SORBI_3004G025200 [Sorghum bicolor]|eukprot:XP_002451455.1 uncharacterized protein LOC8055073 [Sorghum bicolor]